MTMFAPGNVCKGFLPAEINPHYNIVIIIIIIIVIIIIISVINIIIIFFNHDNSVKSISGPVHAFCERVTQIIGGLVSRTHLSVLIQLTIVMMTVVVIDAVVMTLVVIEGVLGYLQVLEGTLVFHRGMYT